MRAGIVPQRLTRSPIPWILAVASLACTPRGGGASATEDAGPPVFARSAFAPSTVDGGVGAPEVASTVDPAALDEILAAAARFPQPDAGDHAALVGTDTGLVADAGARRVASADPAKTSRMRIGEVTVEPSVAGPAFEKAARAQLYWPLVQRCRDASGEILPPEVVHLTFLVARDGHIVPSTVVATSKDARFVEAARCVAREVVMIPFRLPASARGVPATANIDLPSVD